MRRQGKREQIMQAVEKLFTSKRLHEITLDDIVRETHIGKGTIYLYFKDKDDLFFQVAISGFDELCDLLQQRVEQQAPFRLQLIQACNAISMFFADRKQLFRMIQTEDARMSLSHGKVQEQWTEKRRQLLVSVVKIIRKGQTDGVVRKDMSEDALANFLLGLLRTRGRELQDQSSVSDEQLVSLFLNGAGKPESEIRRTVKSDSIGNKVRI